MLGTLDTGGAELRTIEDSEQLLHRGVDVLVVALKGSKGEHSDRFEAMGGRVIPMGLGPKFPLSFVRLLRLERPTVLHSHVASASAWVLALGALARVPRRIAHSRSDGDGRVQTGSRSARLRLRRQLLRIVATDIVGVSPEALRFLQPSSGRGGRTPRTSVLPNAVDTSRLERLPLGARPTGDLTILHVGRANPEKNRVRAVRILAEVSRMLAAQLIMIGPIREWEASLLRGLAESLGVAQGLALQGRVDEPMAYMLRSDVLLVTSTREGLPGAIVEARAVGLPVVSSELPGAAYVEQRLGGVTMLSLEESDGTWADAILAAVSRSDDVIRTRRRGARTALSSSPFDQSQHMIALARLYGLDWPPDESGGDGDERLRVDE